MTGLTNQHHSQAEDADVVETLNYLLENVEAKTALTEKMSAGRDTSMPSSAPNRGPDLTSASEEAEKNVRILFRRVSVYFIYYFIEWYSVFVMRRYSLHDAT